MVRALVCVLFLLSGSVASADLLIVPKSDTVRVRSTTTATGTEFQVQGLGLRGGAYDEIVGYLKLATGSYSTRLAGGDTKAEAFASPLTKYQKSTFTRDPEFLLLNLTLEPKNLLDVQYSADGGSFLFGGASAVCLGEAMGKAGIQDISRVPGNPLRMGTKVMCGTSPIMFKTNDPACSVRMSK